MNFDIKKVRADFPILAQKVYGKPLVYFDNAATSQKPQVMIDKLVEFYSQYNSNIHRGVHKLSQMATEEYEKTRKLVSKLFGANENEIIFTKNDTESLNLIAYTLGKSLISMNVNANIVITDAEHHSNIVPWQCILNNSTETKVTVSNKLRYLTFNDSGEFNIEELNHLIDADTAIFAFTCASNTFGITYNLEVIAKKVREINPKTVIIVDAAQFVPHYRFDFHKLDIDFITFSAHKLCGPTGVGVLIGKESILNQMPPFLCGGDMIKEVNHSETSFNDIPYKFEAGTPNIADVIAFGASLEYLENIGWKNIQIQEKNLTIKLFQELSKLDFIEIYGPQTPTANKLPLISFNLKDIHAHDIGTILDEDGIAVRTGQHCTQLIMRRLKIPATVRASLYFYNSEEEIDILINSLQRANNIFK